MFKKASLLLMVTGLLMASIVEAQAVKVPPKKQTTQGSPQVTAVKKDTTLTLQGNVSLDTIPVRIIYFGDDGGEYKPFVWGFGYVREKNIIIPNANPAAQPQMVNEWRLMYDQKWQPIDRNAVYDAQAFDWRKLVVPPSEPDNKPKK